jgi:hypothetical protein
VSTALTGSHTTYNVGPGQSYATLTAVPWLSLQPGDVVNIYYQATPYATKIGLQAVGTAAQPIIINGVTDAKCDRPIITGANAVESTDSISAGFWATSAGSVVEPEGVIVFVWGPTQAYATLQSYITIQNIEVTGGQGANTYTNHSGQVVHYDTSGTSGIYGVAVSNVTVQYDTITGNDEGVFFNSQDSARTSYYIVLRGNDIYANGMVNNQSVHGVYVQGYRTLYEGNYFGANIVNSLGGTLKDRSSGTVIRNNYIEASLRAIDLVDTEDSPVVLDDPLYNNAWIYGNVIVDNCALGICSSDLIHWGGDSQGNQASSSNYHNGPLFFYYNTVVIENSPATYIRFGVFDMPSSQQSVDAADNIFYFTNMAANDLLELGICCGTVNFSDSNWISNGYVASGENGNAVQFNQQGTLLTGTNPLLNSDFTLSATSGSPVVGQGVLYPTSVPNAAATVTTLQPGAEYANSVIGIVARPNVNDLGAYAAH